MLTGAVLGALIILLILAVIYLVGQNRAYAGQITVLAKEQADADTKVQQLAAHAQKMQQPFIINVTDEQISALSNRIFLRVQHMLDSTTAAALNRMN